MCTRPSPWGGGRTSCLCRRADPSKDRLLLPWEPRVQRGTRRGHVGDTYYISTVAVVRCGGRAGHCVGGTSRDLSQLLGVREVPEGATANLRSEGQGELPTEEGAEPGECWLGCGCRSQGHVGGSEAGSRAKRGLWGRRPPPPGVREGVGEKGGPISCSEESSGHSEGYGLEGRAGLQASKDTAGTVQARWAGSEASELFEGNFGGGSTAVEGGLEWERHRLPHTWPQQWWKGYPKDRVCRV